MSQTKKDKQGNSDKEKKPKLVRDSFTIPKAEYEAIDVLKSRAMAMGNAAKKSELLRAGLMALTQMNNDQFRLALSAVPTLKTGRPKMDKSAPANPVDASPKPVTRPRKTTATGPASAAAKPTPVARKTSGRRATAPARAAAGVKLASVAPAKKSA